MKMIEAKKYVRYLYSNAVVACDLEDTGPTARYGAPYIIIMDIKIGCNTSIKKIKNKYVFPVHTEPWRNLNYDNTIGQWEPSEEKAWIRTCELIQQQILYKLEK